MVVHGTAAACSVEPAVDRHQFMFLEELHGGVCGLQP
jgi:hypothetical protein